MVTTFFPPYSFGGDGIYVRRLATELARRGHHVDVIHCLDSHRLLSKGKTPAAGPQVPNVRVHGLQSPFGCLSPLLTQQTGRPLFKSSGIQRVLKQDFDVIHYHNISLVGGPKILTLGEGIKLYTMHEHWLVCPTHTLFKFNREVCNRRSCVLCTLAHRRPPQLWRFSSLLKDSLSRVDAFIALSSAAIAKHREMGLYLPCTVLPPFIPTGTSGPPDGSSPSQGDEYFLFVGRLEKLKGLQTIIPVFGRYPKARLWVVGTGSYENKLRRMSRDIHNIRFLGRRSQEELVQLYRKALGVIVPSICLEMMPLVILEAMGEAVPVLVRKLGGPAELIEKSGGGLLYSTDEELFAGLALLQEQPRFRQSLGRQGFRIVTEEFTAERHLHRYFELIRGIQAKRPKTAQGWSSAAASRPPHPRQ